MSDDFEDGPLYLILIKKGKTNVLTQRKKRIPLLNKWFHSNFRKAATDSQNNDVIVFFVSKKKEKLLNFLYLSNPGSFIIYF